MTQYPPPQANPFTQPAFWGRRNELQILRGRLLSAAPQSVPIIGEPFIGKTTLVEYIASNWSKTFIPQKGECSFTFVYLDCSPYVSLAEKMGEYAAALFWQDLYVALCKSLNARGEQPPFTVPTIGLEPNALVDIAVDINWHIKDSLQAQQHPVIFVLDNFEGVARLPLHNSEWLRALTKYNCAYLVTSRYLLYLLYQYHPQSWATPSPLWNLFSDPIYLGLMPEQEVDDYLLEAEELARRSGSRWRQGDRAFIREIAGRHPEFIRIACSQLFEHRLPVAASLESGFNEGDDTFLPLHIYEETNALCNQLWYGLINPELQNEPSIPGYSPTSNTFISPYQQALIDIAKGRSPADHKILFTLKQRGLIERVDGKWRVFAGAMQHFVLEQGKRMQQLPDIGRKQTVAEPLKAYGERRDDRSLTYMEGKVYEYLEAHADQVCDREDIKHAVWGNNEISKSALQKIIERLREKIAEDPASSYELVAVRGRGYLLRMR